VPVFTGSFRGQAAICGAESHPQFAGVPMSSGTWRRPRGKTRTAIETGAVAEGSRRPRRSDGSTRPSSGTGSQFALRGTAPTTRKRKQAISVPSRLASLHERSNSSRPLFRGHCRRDCRAGVRHPVTSRSVSLGAPLRVAAGAGNRRRPLLWSVPRGDGHGRVPTGVRAAWEPERHRSISSSPRLQRGCWRPCTCAV
jgi:hypothetical protein